MINQPLPHRESAQTPIREPIAVIGMGCRFPGGGNSPEAFWQFLMKGATAIRQVPLDRWSTRTYYDPRLKQPGKIVTPLGGYLDKVDHFDASFFGISPREAVEIDPQHRGLLEVTWEALEDAGQIPDQLTGTDVGVFVGISTQEYYYMVAPEDMRPYSNIGGAMSIAANRISYVFDFRGPSLIVDTACSSSLVAAHLACQSLVLGECHLALVGGVNLLLSPKFSVGFSQASMLSPDGRCWSFDARANGYVRSEGFGVVALKLLSQAEADGDPIYGVIRGSGANADGRTTGISLPSAEAQAALLRDVYHRAGVSPMRVRYVEAHGTGTLAGDPVEAEALGTVLGAGRAPGDECLLGSVKSSLGHMEAAAGVAGLMKAALCLKHKLIPPVHGSFEPNPQIPFADLRLRIPTMVEPLTGDEPAVVGINSFGFGGANAHLILEEYRPAPNEPVSIAGTSKRRAYLFPLSARSHVALRDYAMAYSGYLGDETSDETSLADLGYSLALRRTHHEHRFAFSAHSRQEAIISLASHLKGDSLAGLSSERRIPQQRPTVAFVFSGMGPQWWAMGRQLLEQEPVFLDTVAKCAASFEQVAGWSLMNELLADEAHSRMSQTEVAQPANFVLQAGLFALWRSWGITPDAIVGHSVGEVAAAYASGALTLEDAVQVVFHRSRLQQQTTGTGTMLAVGMSAEDARAEIGRYRGQVSLAALNSPSSVTLSGDQAALEEIAQTLEQKRIFWRFLKVAVPYHSIHMEPIADSLLASLAAIRPQPVETPLYSTASARWVEGPELNASYWWQNVREPVLFAPAVDAILQAGHQLFLEIGPHPVLGNSISDCLTARGKKGTILNSLRRGEDEQAIMLGTLAEFYAMGFPIAWDALYSEGRFVRFPKYAWQHERYWRESESSETERLGEVVHPLLGHRQPTAYPSWEAAIGPRLLPFLDDHRLEGVVIVPAAVYTETAVAVAREFFDGMPYVVTDLQVHRPFVIADGESIPRAQVLYSRETKELRYYSRVHQGEQVQNTLHVTAKISPPQPGQHRRPPTALSLKEIAGRCTHEVNAAGLYEEIAGRGLTLGNTFRGIKRVQWNDDRTEGLAIVEIPNELRDGIEAYSLHPAVLDCVFQLAAGSPALGEHELYLPVGFESYRVYRPVNAEQPLWIYGQLSYKGKLVFLNAAVLDGGEQVIAELHALRLKRFPDRKPQPQIAWLSSSSSGSFSPFPVTRTHQLITYPAPRELANRVHPEMARFNEQLRNDRYPEMLGRLNALARHYTFRAFP